MAHPVVLYKSCQQDSMKRAMRMEKSRSWPSAHDWKSCIPQKGIEGSNPSFSANKKFGKQLFYVVSRTFSLFVNFTECTESCIHFFRIVCRKSCRPGAICFQLFGFFYKPVYKLLSSNQFSSEYKGAHGNSISCINQQRGFANGVENRPSHSAGISEFRF